MESELAAPCDLAGGTIRVTISAGGKALTNYLHNDGTTHGACCNLSMLISAVPMCIALTDVTQPRYVTLCYFLTAAAVLRLLQAVRAQCC